jgi:hypothetical protein
VGLRIIVPPTFFKLRPRTHFPAGEDWFVVRESGGDWRRGFGAGLRRWLESPASGLLSLSLIFRRSRRLRRGRLR